MFEPVCVHRIFFKTVTVLNETVSVEDTAITFHTPVPCTWIQSP